MDAQYAETVGPDGRATVKIWPGNMDAWTVSQVSVEMGTAPVGAVCTLRKNGAYVSPLIATGDVAGGDPPVTVSPSDRLTVEWQGCTPGDVGAVFIVYDVLGRS